MINLLGVETGNTFYSELQENRIPLELACHSRVATGGVASGQRFTFENQAIRQTSPRQRRGSRRTRKASSDYDYVNFRRSVATHHHTIQYIHSRTGQA